MTTLLIVVIVLMAAMLVAVSLYCMRLYGRNSAFEKENALLGEQHARVEEALRKSNDGMLTMQALREEQFARIAVLESENSALNERVEAQKEQFKVHWTRCVMSSKIWQMRLCRTILNSSTDSRKRGLRLCSCLLTRT